MAVRRTRVSDLLLFAQETKHHQRFASPVARTGSPIPKSEPKTYLNSYQEWHQALNDALENWVPHKRQSLAMGLAAYGLRGLRLPPEVVKEGIVSVATTAEDEELKRRLEAFTRTLEKFNKGQVVTWHRYYLEAAVDPPITIGLSDAVAAKLPLSRHILDSHPWSGSSGLSDRSVYEALYSLACEFGKDHEQGIAVSIDVRTLALKAGLSDATRNKALKRLHEAGLVRRDHEAKNQDVPGFSFSSSLRTTCKNYTILPLLVLPYLRRGCMNGVI